MLKGAVETIATKIAIGVVVSILMFWSDIATLAATAASASSSSTAAYILVDHDTGNVLEAANESKRLPPASVTKLLTALVAISKIPTEKPIAVSVAAASMPPMKIGLTAGETWSRDDLLHSLLMVSANDAAVALAESASGSLQQFAIDRQAAASALGLRDSPVFNDPSGLDDAEHSFNGGDLVSARDMAIIARAALDEPLIRSIVVKQRHQFVGGDGKNHTLRNHNKMLASYAGSVGMKPGYTSKAKNTMVAAATRDGRTMIAVVLNADNPYVIPATLMDRGFTMSMAGPSASDNLPRSSLQASVGTSDRPAVAAPVVDGDDVWVRAAGMVFILAFVVAVFHSRLSGFRRQPALEA